MFPRTKLVSSASFKQALQYFSWLCGKSAHSSDYFKSLFDVSSGHQRYFTTVVSIKDHGINSHFRLRKFPMFALYVALMEYLWSLY